MISFYYAFFCADEPENVRLNVNISNNKVCAGIIVLFTCTADANPEVNNFTLYENDTMLNMSRSGERIKAISKHGRVTYTCEGNNSVGSKKSSSITLNVEGELACNVNSFFI